MIQIHADGALVYDSRLEDYTLRQLKVTTGLNKGGTATITMPAGHPAYSLFVAYRTIVEITRDGRRLFRGRALPPSDDFNNNRTVTCEGELCFLHDAISRPYLYQDSPANVFSAVIGVYNAQVEEFKRFQVGTVTVTDPNEYIRLESEDAEPVQDTVNKLLARCGGCIVFDTSDDGNRRINWYAKLTHHSQQIIEYGENLIDFSRSGVNDNLATAILPYGAKDSTTGKRLTIENVNAGSDYIKDDEAVALRGMILATVTWDDVTDPYNLYCKALEWLTTNRNVVTSLSISALDLSYIDKSLEGYKVGDLIRVKSKPHMVDDDFTLEQKTEDLLNPANDKITLGKKRSSLIGESVAGDTKSLSEMHKIATQIKADYQVNIANAVQTSEIKMTSLIQQTSSSILIQVSEDYATNDQLTSALSETTAKLSTEIKAVSDALTLKVSKDDLISEINQSPEAIKINASRIDLQGAVTFSAFDADAQNRILSAQTAASAANKTISSWCMYNNETYIDGSNIYTGTITADKLKVDTLESICAKIGGFTIDATTLKSSGGGYTAVLACYDNNSSTSRVMHCYVGDDPNADTFRILRDGTVISGGSKANQVRMQEGHLDFYYGDAYSGRLGQSADNKITIEGTHLQLDAGKYLYGDGLQLIGTSTSGNIAIGNSSQNGHVFVYTGAGDIRLVSGKGYRTRIYYTNDSGNVQVANWWQSGLTLVNGKSILGTTTSNSAINLVQMSAANNVVIGSSSQPGNTHIYCNSTTYTKFYVGSDNIASVTVAGLQFKNESGIVLNGKIALRYYDSKVYCGADTEPLVLTGSSISFSGTISSLSVGALTATSATIDGTLTAKAATINGTLTATGATINGTATVNGLTVNGGVTAYSLTTTYGVTCASLTTSGNVSLDNNKYVTAKNTSGTAYNILGINSSGHATFGSSSLAGNAYVMCKDGYYVNLRVGSVNVAAISSSGLLMPNDMMIMCGTASKHVNAIRLKTTEIGVGYASIPLKLVGSAVTSNGSAVTSDRRLKTDINPLGDKYTKLIDKLSAVNYRYTTHRQNVVNCGFVAQDVLAALSEVGLTADEFGGFVDVYGNGREFALDYTQFVPILWEQIKSLKAKIKTLEEVNL